MNSNDKRLQTIKNNNKRFLKPKNDTFKNNFIVKKRC